jgi:predicted kinase
VTVTLVAGPPCAGKSTYAGVRGHPVLDWDAIYAEWAGLPMHVHAHNHEVISARVEQLFQQQLKDAWHAHTPIVVIRAAPERWHRGMYRRLYSASVVVLAVAEAECVRRLHASQRPKEAWERTEAEIRAWWHRYEPSGNDVVAA